MVTARHQRVGGPAVSSRRDSQEPEAVDDISPRWRPPQPDEGDGVCGWGGFTDGFALCGDGDGGNDDDGGEVRSYVEDPLSPMASRQANGLDHLPIHTYVSIAKKPPRCDGLR